MLLNYLRQLMLAGSLPKLLYLDYYFGTVTPGLCNSDANELTNNGDQPPMEIWLRTNRRILLLGMILPVVLIVVGLILALALGNETVAWLQILGWAMAGIGLLLCGIIVVQLKLPRIAYADGNLLVYLRSGRPIRVPVEIVECFFLGSGAGQLPGPEGQELPVRNLMMRVAEKASEFQQREVKPTLGRWAEGYVTFHGAWCEQLTLEVVQRLNSRLAAAHQLLQDARST